VRERVRELAREHGVRDRRPQQTVPRPREEQLSLLS
jgi:hypothetical protein